MDAKCDLTHKKCIPCESGTTPLPQERAKELLAKLDSGWKLVDSKAIEKTYTFDNFIDALAFTNKVGEIAEREGHHPDIFLSWGKVTIKLWTHSVNGLSENDFILAAKSDALLH